MNFSTNIATTKSTKRWQLAFVACYLWVFLAGSAGAMINQWSATQSVDEPATKMVMTDSHAHHELHVKPDPCENHDCKLSSDCEKLCAIGASCASVSIACSSVLATNTPTLQTENLPLYLPSVVVTRRPDALFRPPIL